MVLCGFLPRGIAAAEKMTPLRCQQLGATRAAEVISLC